MSPPAIPEKALFQAWAETWLPVDRDKIIDTTVSDADARMFACYYDVPQWAYACKAAGLITGSLCDSLIANWITTYRDTYLPSNTPSGWNPSIFYLMSTGLAKHYLANTGTNGASKTALANLKTFCPYIWAGSDQSKYSDIHYARENAFSLLFYINNFLVGNDGTIDVRAATLKANCLTLFTNWRNGTANYTQFYIRPFMVALVTDALIYYGDNVSALSTADKDAIDSIWDYLHTTLYRGGDPHPSLKFTSVVLSTMSPTTPNTPEQAGLVSQNQDPANQDGPGTDVSLMHVHIYAWLYKQGYRSTTWQTRADDIFINGYPHYIFDVNYSAGQYYQNYGAWVGTRTLAGIESKHTSQQLFRFAEFVRDRELGPSGGGGSYTSGSVGTAGGFHKFNKIGYFGRKSASTAVAYNAFTYFTGATKAFWYKINDTAKVLDASDVVAVNNSSVKTVNDEWASSASLVQATVANQPVCKTGVSNGRQSIQFTGSPMTMPVTNFASALNSATKVSFWAVFKLNATSANATFFRCYENTFTNQRFRCFLNPANPSMDMSVDTALGVTRAATSWNGGSVTALTTGAVHAVLWEWNIATSSCQIYVDSYTATMDSTAAPGTSIAASNLQGPEVGLLGSVDILDSGLLTGALCSDRPGLFAALKTEFGITVY